MSAILPFEPPTPRRVFGRLALRHPDSMWVMTGIEPHVALKLKGTFPKVPKTEAKTFTFRHSPETCADLDWFLIRYPMAMDEGDRRALKAGKHSFDRSVDDLERILLPDWQPPAFTGFREGLALYGYQAQAVEVARQRGRLLLGDDVGLGKTITALGTLTDSTCLPAAIVVQAHLAFQWANFVKKFTHLRPHVIGGTQPYDLPQADLYIFRYSNIAGWVDIAEKGLFRSIVFDEVQELRTGTKTQKGQAAAVFARAAARLRMGLSATPIYNHGDEIFPIVDLIEPGALGDVYEFRREWCTPRGQKWVVADPDALGTYLREQHLLLRRTRAGGPVNTLVHEVAYDEKVAAEAEDLAQALAIKVVSGSFTERGQAARDLDILARQVTGMAKAKHVAAFVRMLLESGQPVLLAGWHREVYVVWLEELKAFEPVMYTGSETPAAKERAKERFVSGETDLMIISLRSGVGLDGLQHRCCTVVIGELDWSPQVHEQIVGRLDRPGQTQQVQAIYLHANGGSDPLIIDMLGLKASQARGVMDPLSGVQHVHSDESRLRLLAEQYLGRRPAAEGGR
ncbi:SNF2-related protein [Methylobacterium aquaticum]|uniref:SNF2-related protein n=1 Tax=Methylobacterium aquaticum TaxID=270351 RepID=UPI003D1764EE